MKFYSIIVPTFNSAQTLQRCLDSILNQTFEDFEIIIADGLSTDLTVSIAETFRDERINLFSESDLGVYDAMNKALEKAQGKWILFLGSDDFLFDDFVLESMKGKLEKTPAKLVYGDVKIVGNTSWANDGEIYRGAISVPLLLRFNICHQCIFYNHLVFKNKRYNLNYPVCADYDFNLYCAANYTLEYQPITISGFTAGGISTTLIDEAFANEMWTNTIIYFNDKLLSNDFIGYRTQIKRAFSAFIKRFEIKNAFLALRIYGYLTLKRVIKW